MNKIALSVDIEDWYHGPAVVGSEFSKFKTIEDFHKKNEFNFDKLLAPLDQILELFNSKKVKATFFVVGDLAERCPAIIKRITKENHEIACHGLYHYAKYDNKKNQMRFTNNEFKDLTKKSKDILEQQTGIEIIGYRAPGAYVCGEMLDCLEELNFKYDSSVCVNSIYKKSGGDLSGVCTNPYYPEKGSLKKSKEQRGIIEYPWAYYNLFGFKFPTAGGPFLRFFGSKYIKRGIKQSLKRGHTGLYFHAIDISEETFPNLGKSRPFYFSVKGKKVKKDISNLIDMFQGIWSTYADLLETNQSSI